MDVHQPAAAKDGGAEPFTPRQLRILKIAVTVMSIILVVGLAVVIGRIAYLVANGGTPPPSSAHARVKDARLALPPGAAVRSIALNGDRLAVHYETTSGAGIAILDLATGEPVTHVDLAPK